MYVYIYIYMCVCVCVRMCVYMYMRMYVCVCVCVFSAGGSSKHHKTPPGAAHSTWRRKLALTLTVAPQSQSIKPNVAQQRMILKICSSFKRLKVAGRLANLQACLRLLWQHIHLIVNHVGPGLAMGAEAVGDVSQRHARHGTPGFATGRGDGNLDGVNVHGQLVITNGSAH